MNDPRDYRLGRDIRLVFLDLETTGLDPLKDDILEIGCKILDHELRVLDSFHILVKPTMTRFEDQTFGSHLITELWQEANSMDATNREDAVNELQNFFRESLNYDDQIFLAGNNVHFDRGFLPRDLFRGFHYRHLDLSPFKVMAELGWVEKFEETGQKHRVMSDIDNSIAHLKSIRDRYFQKKPPFPTEALEAALVAKDVKQIYHPPNEHSWNYLKPIKVDKK